MIKSQNHFDSLIFGGSGQDGFFMSRFLLKKKKKNFNNFKEKR